MYTYDKPLAKDEVFVGYCSDCEFSDYDSLGNKLRATSDRFGFTLKEFSVEELASLKIGDQYKLRHFIIVSDRPLDEAVSKFAHLSGQLDNLSLSMVFPSDEVFKVSGRLVDQYKIDYNQKINFLRPDEVTSDHRHFVSVQKIVDNAVCDSVRIKYIAKLKGEDISSLQEQYYPFFQAAGKLYTERKLYHRSVTDGFFAIRVGDGFLISATKTDKSKMDKKRIAFVHGYDPLTNTLEYSGPYLPSSDVVEASIVFANAPKVKAMIHTHASDLFTRNPYFASKIKVPKMSYGEPELGHMIAEIIEDYIDDYIIMEDHGEVFAMDVQDDIVEPVRKAEAICIQAEKECQQAQHAGV